MGHAKGHEKAHGGLQTPAPASEHVTGKGHEKQHPEAAAGGQETATEKKPEATPPSADHPEATPKPPRPVAPPPPPSTPKEAPENPPAAAPEPPQQAPPSQSRSDSVEKVTGGEGPGASGTHSKVPEKTS